MPVASRSVICFAFEPFRLRPKREDVFRPDQTRSLLSAIRSEQQPSLPKSFLDSKVYNKKVIGTAAKDFVHVGR